MNLKCKIKKKGEITERECRNGMLFEMDADISASEFEDIKRNISKLSKKITEEEVNNSEYMQRMNKYTK